MSNLTRESVPKIWPIRSKSLRNFLTLYYRAHIASTKQEKDQLTFKRVRKPKIWPGLRFIECALRCSKRTAQDYLRAIEITHDIFLKYEIEKRCSLVAIDDVNYEKLLKKIAQSFGPVAIKLGVRRIKPGKLNEIRQHIGAVEDAIKKSSGAFTPKQCTKIIHELTSLLY